MENRRLIVFGVIAFLVIVGFLFFFPVQIPEGKDAFSNGLFKLNNVWLSVGIDLDKGLGEDELIAFDSVKLDDAIAQFSAQKDSFKEDSLKKLSTVFVSLSEEFLLKKQILLQAVNLESISEEELCDNVDLIDAFREDNKQLYDKKIETNTLMKDFIVMFSKESDKADMALLLINEDDAFWNWNDAENAALDLKEKCLNKKLGELA